ncbi:aminoglycoside phosphotransferase family protein [Streptomyces sp. NBC_00250]|uniref:phosphotransferase enzyme family protein n=1 Tax=Streptomyces sp. NBC_00250 TaxID=2903641 RepID=UPI002E2DD10C|nr:aminoglycoside phosphotransferase family protein [Streptomyces sp. NBC_00250]
MTISSRSLLDRVTLLLAGEFGIVPASLAEGPAGTATRNYVAETAAGDRWFVKTYPAGTDLARAEAAAGLSEYARLCGVPVARARPVVDQERLVASYKGTALSVTAYVAGAVTADGQLVGRRWETVGATVGRLHRGLARHPLGPPALGARDRSFDPARARVRLADLVRRYEVEPPRSGFEQWASRTARERLAALPLVERLLEKAPSVTTSQIVHGDLSGPNVLLRGDRVAAVIDFHPPGRRDPMWELGRLALDPRTVLTQADWPEGLARLAAAYHELHPTLPVEELVSVVRLTAAYLGCAVYPLNTVADGLGPVTPSLEAYARSRALAAVELRERLDEAEEVLRDHLR